MPNSIDELRMNSNSDLRAYLERFCCDPGAPRFAVMLKGAWGSGKTWFIKDFIEELPEKIREKTLYVSLYGVAKPADIEEAFFRQLHPILANEKVKYGYSIIKGFLKGTFKIDLDGDKKDDATLQLSLPELVKFSSNPESTVFIFDDLERAVLPPDVLLGYINQFVEHEGRRVIVIANEDNLQESHPKFRSVKEKVIGRTFEIAVESDTAISNFIDEASLSYVKPILTKRKHIIQNVFYRAGHGNLRNVRQALADFGNLWTCLASEQQRVQDQEGFQDRLLEEVLSMSLEFRAGTLSAHDIRTLEAKPQSTSAANRQANRDKTVVTDRDPISVHGLSASRAVLLPSAYAHFFERGHVSSELAREGLERGAFFTDESKPAWQQLWHRFELTDENFDKQRTRLLKEFTENAYRKPEELLHAFGILLTLAADGLLDRSTADIAQLGKRVSDHLLTQGLLQVDVQPESTTEFKPNLYSAYGMEFQGRDLPEFKEFADPVVKEWSLRHAMGAQTNINGWLNELSTDHEQWESRIAPAEQAENSFYEQPVFASVQPKTFASIIFSLKPASLTFLVAALDRRYYAINRKRSWMMGEADFWEHLARLVQDKTASQAGRTLSGHVLAQDVLPMIEGIAEDARAIDTAFKEEERKLFKTPRD